MSLRDDFLEQLSPEYGWLPGGGGLFLITKRRGHKLIPPVRLHLDEKLFERYTLWIARTSEDGDIGAGLGLIFIHLDAEFAADRPPGTILTDIGVRRGQLGRPNWLATRVPDSDDPADDPDQPRFLWVADPPPR
jgi:hypothetical protein